MSQRVSQVLIGTLSLLVAATLAGCVEQQTMTTIPDAENVMFTTQGDLIVSGGSNIYQVTASTNGLGETEYQRRAMYDGKCMFAGIAQQGDWVFTACQEYVFKRSGFFFSLVRDNHLLAANIHQRPMMFTALDKKLKNDPMDALSLPNGMALTPDGKLLLADGNLLATAGVARISVDTRGSLPSVTKFERNWVGTDYGLSTPNGVRVSGNELFISDGNKVRRMTFDSQGNLPLEFIDQYGSSFSNKGADNVIYSGGILIDDIMPVCGGVAVTHFVAGQLVYVNRDGDSYATQALSFESPSSMAIGQAPMFSGSDLIVTEKGILYDKVSKVGNKATHVPLRFDVNDPATCQAF